jgi:hypothetical protein
LQLEEESMRRLLGAIAALGSLLLAGRAAAAEISRVASSGEPGSAFGLDVSVRWDRSQERATITRERTPAPDPSAPLAAPAPDILRYTRTRNAIVPRVAVGLYRDLELHAEVPYVLEDDQTYRYGNRYGQPNGGTASSIDGNTVDPSGAATAASPMFSFTTGQQATVYHGGRAGDLLVGLAWAVFNDRKDSTRPTWVLGMDVTAPTSTAYDPAKERTAARWASPYGGPASPAPVGERIWKWDLYTVLSRRVGAFDPYVKAHYTATFASSSTYSNCQAAQDRTLSPSQFNTEAATNCASWGAAADAKPPWMAGLVVGTEIVAYEDATDGQRLVLDLRLRGDYTSSQRFFNELTDASGKIHQTEGYLETGGVAGIFLSASRYVQFRATAGISTRTSHWLTGEAPGRNGSTPALGANGLPIDPAQWNPNYDARYDAPGHRFRISEVAIFDVSVAGVLRF